MAALPYIQLYVADYLADTAHLSTVEHGAYLLLIMNYWQRGEPFRANDERTLSERLARVVRMDSEAWSSVEKTLAEFFSVTETEWRHPRIDRDLEAVHAKSIKARASASVSVKNRTRGKITNSSGGVSERSANAQRTLSHTEAEADTDTDTDTEQYLGRNGDQGSKLEKIVLSRVVGESAVADPAAAASDSGSDLLGDPAPATKPKRLNGHLYAAVVDLFHETLPELSRCQVLTDQRKKAIRRLAEYRVGDCGLGEDLENWRGYFKHVRRDDWLMGRKPGRDGTPFKARIDHVLNPDTFVRITEG
jgi:uncharacterized protein YdaU (DUF1376 family)